MDNNEKLIVLKQVVYIYIYICIYIYIYIILLYGIFKYITDALFINSIVRGSALSILASCLLHFPRTIMMPQTKKICMGVVWV